MVFHFQNKLVAQINGYTAVELEHSLHTWHITPHTHFALSPHQPPPTTPASAADFKDKSHRFAIQHGKAREQTQEFFNFKQHYCLSWGR